MKSTGSCFIDLHCHIDFYKDKEISKIVKEANEKGVGFIVVNGVKPENNRNILKLAEKYDSIKVGLGLYPIDALSLTEAEVDKELEFIRENEDKIVAIGEVGVDFKEDEKEHAKQIKIFRKIVQLGKEINRPLIIHSRKAEKGVIDVLEEEKAKKVVMHCFNGSFKLIERIVSNGWSMTIPTNVTFSEHFQKAVALVPIEQLFCETDSPYLHPRKERNNVPGNVIESYKKIAEIKCIGLNEVRDKIFDNYKRMF